jgi:feruloyl esterase
MFKRQMSLNSGQTRTFSTSVRAAISAATLIGCTYATQAQAQCESLLSSLHLPDTLITAAQSIPAGTYTPPGGTPLTGLPAFCRFTATISPVPDSSIGIEVWLPTTTWNGKYQQSGNHGLGGTYYWGEMAPQLIRGYATGITNQGHTAVGNVFDASWAMFHPEKIIDHGWRAVHELSEKAKLIVAAYYGKRARYAYFNGCSDGGREGLKDAQMFPLDFDGIIAGSAFPNITNNITASFVYDIDQTNAGLNADPARTSALTLAGAASSHG